MTPFTITGIINTIYTEPRSLFLPRNPLEASLSFFIRLVLLPQIFLLLIYMHLSSPHSALSLSDVEEKCKQAAALKLPLSSLELNTEEVRELFQVSNTDVSVIYKK